MRNVTPRFSDKTIFTRSTHSPANATGKNIPYCKNWPPVTPSLTETRTCQNKTQFTHYRKVRLQMTQTQTITVTKCSNPMIFAICFLTLQKCFYIRDVFDTNSRSQRISAEAQPSREKNITFNQRANLLLTNALNSLPEGRKRLKDENSASN